MSLTGRILIDRVKRSIGKYVRLPVPPYHNPAYWEGVYRQLGPGDVFEWGGISYADVQKYTYKKKQLPADASLETATPAALSLINSSNGESYTASWGDTLCVYPHSHKEEPILMLGCGNSKFGEDMIAAGWNGPIVQVDVASRVIESMSQRCSQYLESGDIQLVQDDATVLSAFQNATVHAVVDKGLIDAVYCADDYEQCFDIMRAVHRVLIPSGIFCCFSFSQPEFLLQHLIHPPPDTRSRLHLHQIKSMWQNVQIRELDGILLYRFQKSAPNEVKSPRKRRQGAAHHRHNSR